MKLAALDGLIISLIVVLVSLMALLFAPMAISTSYWHLLPPHTDSAQKVIIKDFFNEMESRGIPVPHIQFYKYPSNFFTDFLGVNEDLCITNGKTRIVILTEKAKQRTIFHELGHCALLRGHEYYLNPDGYPNSWMHQMNHEKAEVFITKNKDYYIEELFSVQNTIFEPNRYEPFLFPSKTFLKFYQMWQMGTASSWDFAKMASLIMLSLLSILACVCLVFWIFLQVILKSKNYHD